MQILVIDFDCSFAITLGRVLEHAGCQVQVASSIKRALALLRQSRFELILIDSSTPLVASRAILREIYTRVPSRVYVMTDVPPLEIEPETRREKGMAIVPATAESVLLNVRETGDSDVALVAGSGASKDLARTLLEAGYPTALTRDLGTAVRLFFEGTYPVVFLQGGVPTLAEPDELAVLHTLTAQSLAALAHDLTSDDLRCGIKPHRIAEVTQILKELQEDSGKPVRAMSSSSV